MIEVREILAIIAKKRPIFHSEADFQHTFAWEIHQKLPNASVRLELPVQVKNQYLHIDVWIKNQDEILAVELKYKTRGLSVQIDNEQYRLKNQSAQDIGRYDFIKDIQRLEHVASEQSNFIGYAVLLTNDSAYWIKPASHDTVDADFRINDGRVLEGVCNWGVNASDGTKKNREQSLVLQDKYIVQWENFSRPSPASYGEFRSLTIKVT
ncbi:MAG: hypothetical protein HZB19_10105 [Chloroflexi bacterium]|nr:hypothetical protein [Chloroflexota bacterium]